VDQYVALDVSLQKTAVCVLNVSGRVLIEADVPSEPAALIAFIQTHAPRAARVGLESGPTSPWLWHSLKAAGLPAVCMDARHAHAALSVRPSKSDRNDARGLAEMMRMGWYREVQVKSLAAHERMALLGVRRRLVDMRVEIDGQIRGILKTFGLVVGSGNKGAFAQRARMLAQDHPVLSALIEKLIEVREVAVAKVVALDKEIRRFVRDDLTLRRFMTVPGVGPVTALAFRSTIDEPNRFKRARDVGPYLGLTPRRYQSGETDRQGGISKCGDRFTRTCLYEAASVLLTKVQRWSPLKAWGTRLARRIGSKKARVAIARKIAVILRCIWTDGTEFWWTKETATA
jgi:transposase